MQLSSRLSSRSIKPARRIVTAALVTLALAVSACSSPAPSVDPSASTPAPGDSGGKKGTIAFSFQYAEVPAYGPIKAFATAKANELGYELVTDNIQGGNVDEQIASLDNFIAQGVDALVVHQQDPAIYASIIERAHAAGIKYIGYFQPSEGEDGLVAFDQRGAAEQCSVDAANWINENLGGKAKVLIHSLSVDQVGREITEVLGASILEQTDAEIVATQDAIEQATGLQTTQDTLTAHPDLNVVLSWNDGGALGAAQAFELAGVDPAGVYICSKETGQVGLQALADGNKYLKGMSVLSLKILGEGVAQVPVNVLTGQGESDLVVDQVFVRAGETERINELLAEFE